MLGPLDAHEEPDEPEANADPATGKPKRKSAPGPPATIRSVASGLAGCKPR